MIPPSVYRDVPRVIDISAYSPIVFGVLYLAAWFAREHLWSIERERLLDRLMSKDIKEFKAVTQKVKPEPKSWGMLDDETMAELEDRRKAEIMKGA